MSEEFIVICLDDNLGTERDRQPQRYVLATRRVFTSWDDAQHYASTVATSRLPMVIPGAFDQLRFERRIPPPPELHDYIITIQVFGCGGGDYRVRATDPVAAEKEAKRLAEVDFNNGKIEFDLSEICVNGSRSA
jgi:hypothetical protein